MDQDKDVEDRLLAGLEGEDRKGAHKMVQLGIQYGMGEEAIRRQIERTIRSHKAARAASEEGRPRYYVRKGLILRMPGANGNVFRREYIGSFDDMAVHHETGWLSPLRPAPYQKRALDEAREWTREPIRFAPEKKPVIDDAIARMNDGIPLSELYGGAQVDELLTRQLSSCTTSDRPYSIGFSVRSDTGRLTSTQPNIQRIRLPQESSAEYAETVKRLEALSSQWEPAVPNLRDQWPKARDTARSAGMELHNWPLLHPKLTTWEWFSYGSQIVARVLRIQSPHDTGQICVAESDLLKIIAGTYDHPEDDLIAGCFLKPPRTTSLREDDFANRPTPWAPEVL
jgi:hypothetical protein